MKVWTEHASWLSPDGKTVCSRCKIDLPNLVPGQVIVCTSGEWLTFGHRIDAVQCKKVE